MTHPSIKHPAPPARPLLEKRNPATGEPFEPLPLTTPAELDALIRHCHEAVPSWQASSLARRAAALHRLADALLLHQDSIALLISEEVGKPIADALQSDILPAVMELRYIAAKAPKHYRTKPLMAPSAWLLGRLVEEQSHPHGVVAVIAPWNYPLGIPTGIIASALMAGNGVVFKPSEKTPRTGLRLQALVRQAFEPVGLPPALVQCIVGDGRLGQALVEHPLVQALFFTGSEPVGRKLQKLCAARNIPANLELGGMDAAILLPSAEALDLDALAAQLIWGRFSNAGQTCAAVKHVYVPDALFDTFREMLTAKLLQLHTGNPLLPQTQVGPLIDALQRHRIESQLQDALDKGAIAVSAPLDASADAGGYYLPPTLLLDCPSHALVCNEEVFGPLLPVFRYTNLTDVLALLHAIPLALGCSVFGNMKEARLFAMQLPVAQVGINTLPMTHYAFPEVPWLGWKQTGPGVRHGIAGLDAFIKRRIQSVAPLMSLPRLGLSKDAWLFSKTGGMRRFAKALLANLGPRHPWQTHPLLAILAFWQQRPSNKL